MSLQPNRNIVIVGVGPFLSRSLGIWLAEQKWNIVLISRSEEGLSKCAADIEKAYPDGQKVLTKTADAGNPTALLEALNWASGQLGGKIDVLNFNAARVAQDDIMTLEAETLEKDFKIGQLPLCVRCHHDPPPFSNLDTAIGTLTAGQWFSKNANTDRVKDGEYPLFLVPGSRLDRNPHPAYASLSATKAATQNLTKQFSMVMPEKYNVLVGEPLAVEPIIPNPEGGFFTKSVPDVLVQKIFRPFFEAREKVMDGGKGWQLEHLY